MWMMGYNDGVELNSINQDSFNGRNIPLVRTTACSRISGTDLLALNHNLAMGGGGDRNKRELHNGGATKQQVVVSTRWNPTLEQIQTLEELYKRGTRTPSAEEIQHITAQLRRYGKIEGKNVFYWFQNHKARERQKRRRQLDHDQVDDEPPTHNYTTQTHHVQNKESSSPEENGTVIFEVEESKNWASPTNSISTILAEKNVATQGAEAAAAAAADSECKSDGWLQFDHAERNATWHIISSPYYPPVSTCVEPCILENSDHSAAAAAGDAQTLQLFPLGSGGGCEDDKEEEEESGSVPMNDISDDVMPYQFFEFLPLKN